jgi:hypothetical protein
MNDGALHVKGGYQPLLRQLSIDADAVFDHPDITCWRKLPDRENCTLDANLPDFGPVRLHIKRYVATRGRTTPADGDVAGHRLLEAASIPTAPLLAHGNLRDGRSFVIFDDLAGYTPADKLIERGTPFEPLIEPTADLAAKLHNAGLHHRDLYLCHFMTKVSDGVVDLKLIDTARVRKLPSLLSQRWIVKDLAQFWYSTLKLPISEEQRLRWLARYGARRQTSDLASLQRRIERKARSIARHDTRLHRDRPERDVSVPTGPK